MIRALILGCAALSVASQAPAPIDCVLRRIAMDLPASDDPSGARGIARCNAVTLCCPHTTRAHSDAGCVLLYGIDGATLAKAQPDEVVRIRPEPSAILPNLPPATVASFGNLAPVTGSVQFDPPYSPDSPVLGGLEPPPPPAGALFVDRRTSHGNRTTLHVIVGALDQGNGDVRTWTQPCREVNVRKTFFGSDGGTTYATGGSPYALRPECRLANSTCRFNTRDHLRSVSQNRVDFIAEGSKVVTLGSLPNYPPAFCAFYSIINLVRSAVRATGVDPDAFGNMVVYVPKHCAIGQGEQPGRNVIVQLCPGGDRDNLYSAISHELGHNLGLGHGSLYQGSEYGDGSSFMGSGGGGRINTLSLAMRHAFRWLPGDGRSGIYVNAGSGPSVSSLVLRLVDINTAVALPIGARWGAKIDDVDASWYVSYPWPATVWNASAISNTTTAWNAINGSGAWASVERCNTLDGTNSSDFGGRFTVNSLSVWWQIQLPLDVTLTSYSFANSVTVLSSPTEWTLKSSVDGVNFGTVQSYAAAWTLDEVKVFAVTEVHAASRYWRLDVTRLGDNVSHPVNPLRLKNITFTASNIVGSPMLYSVLPLSTSSFKIVLVDGNGTTVQMANTSVSWPFNLSITKDGALVNSGRYAFVTGNGTYPTGVNKLSGTV